MKRSVYGSFFCCFVLSFNAGVLRVLSVGFPSVVTRMKVVLLASDIGCGRLSLTYWEKHTAYLVALVMDAEHSEPSL